MKRFTKVCLIICGVTVALGGTMTAVAAGMGSNVSNMGWPVGSKGRVVAQGITGGIGEMARDVFEDLYDIRYDAHGTTWGAWGEVKEKIKDNVKEAIKGHGDDYDDDDADADADTETDAASNEEAAGENRVEFAKEDVRSLKLDVNRGRVIMLTDSDSDKITVSGNTDRAMEVNQNASGELKVAVGPDKWWLNQEDGQLTVYIHVPKGFRFEKAELKCEAKKKRGTIKGPSIRASGLLADRLELSAYVGAINVTGGDAGKLDVSCDVGSVNFDGSVSTKVEADCDVGSINLILAGAATDYNYQIKCELGSINVDGRSFAGFSNKQTIDNGGTKKMELECDVGSLNVKFK